MTSQTVTCSRCGIAHDISEIEPSLRRPDAILGVPSSRRGVDTFEGDDFCVLTLADGSAPRHFLRVLMPFSVSGREVPCSWGIWVEVAQSSFSRAWDLWSDPTQHLEPPFEGMLANAIHGYPSTLGLTGTVQLRDPSSVPVFTLSPSSHPLVAEQMAGVPEQTVLDWLAPFIHPA
jgi:hypothetical protein